MKTERQHSTIAAIMVAGLRHSRYDGQMATARHMLLAFLAVIGIISVMPIASASAACPVDTMASMPMMHHGHHGPNVPVASNACPACLAVLQSAPIMKSRALPPAALSSGLAHQLSGIGPDLDPPPPRGA